MNMPEVSSIYSIPYLIVALILLWVYKCDQREYRRCHLQSSSKYAVFAQLLLLVFIGLRGHLYTDYINYYPFYEELPNILDFRLKHFGDYGWEPGFVIYSSILKTIMPNYFGWVFVNTLIDIIVLSSFFRKHTQSIPLALFFFIAYWGLQFEFNLYRNVKALLLFVLSFKYIERGKFIPYLLINLLGALFHSSAFIYILLYPIFRCKQNTAIIILLIIVVNILYFSHFSVSSIVVQIISPLLGGRSVEKIYEYVANSSEIGFTIGYFERTFELFLFVALRRQFQAVLPSYQIFFNLYLCYYCIYMLFADMSILTQRLPILLLIGYWVLLVNVFRIQFPYKRIVTCILIIFALYRIIMSNNTIVSRYDNLLWGIESYEERRTDFYKHVEI